MQYVHINRGDAIEVGNVGNLVCVRRLKTIEKAVVGFQSGGVPTVYVI